MLTVELETVLGETESVCPECLARIPALRVGRGSDVYLKKACPEHGLFQTIIWRGQPAWAAWARPKAPGHPRQALTPVSRGCPFDCGLCPDHRQQSCCVLLEVTQRCDLLCPVCFAAAGGRRTADPSLASLTDRLRQLIQTAGPVNLQLSGGEPCVRTDLPAIAAQARALGFTFIQVNSNGLRLARDPDFAQRLQAAGVATVFLQFDGTRDDIYQRLRGRKLLARKLRAIEHCAAAGLGVVLAPTVAPGVNADNLGAILRFALAHQPAVRGVHFQPISYFGRYPLPLNAAPTDAERITLPEIISALEAQSGGLVRRENFQPAGAENAWCSFNGNFVSLADGRLVPLTRAPAAGGCCAPTSLAGGAQPAPGGLERARHFVARNWAAPGQAAGSGRAAAPSLGEWDVVLQRARTHALCLSGMAFQDAWTLDLERLRECHIHIAAPDGACVPFCAYNLTDRSGRSLYRQTLAPAAVPA